MKEIAHFKVSTGIKNIIGRELITDDIVAVFELVKNSFDADAKTINVNINPNCSRIEIRDDGIGMTATDIKEKWLFIAYSEKNDQSTSKIYAGSKGIGRFSCDTLGSKLYLHTRKNGITTSLSIDWDDFESDNNNKIEDLDVIIEMTEEDLYGLGNSGTSIIIESLRTNWSFDHAKKALSRLKQLLNPIEIVNNTDLFFSFESENSEQRIDEKVKNDAFDSLGEKTTFVECNIENKYLYINLNSQGHMIYSATYTNPFSIKNISSKIYFMDTRSKADFKRKTGIDSVKFGNIFVFKNNFRVYPYGEQDYDFFKINLRKAQGYNRYLGGRELLGWINIIDRDNLFIESSSRNNGFINGVALSELEEFYYDFIQKSLEKYVSITRFGVEDIDSILDNESKKRKVIDELTSHLKKYEKFLLNLETFDIPTGDVSIKEKIAALSSEDIPQKQKNRILGEINSRISNIQRENQNLKNQADKASKDIERLRQENKQKDLILSKKKPDRQEFLAHELTKASNDIDEIINSLIDDPNDLSALADLKKVSYKLASIKNIVLRTNLDTKSSVEVDIVSFVKECFSMSFYKRKNLPIIFENDQLIIKKTIKLFDFNVLLDNLYFNAKELGASFFKIIFSKDNVMFLSDTGPVDDYIVSNAFNLGFSTKNGTGFGLYIVKEIVNDHRWKIKMVGNSTSKNVYFELEF